MEETKAIDPREACNALTRAAREKYDSMTEDDNLKNGTPAIVAAVAIAFDAGARACAEAACGRDVDGGALLSKIIAVSSLAELLSAVSRDNEAGATALENLRGVIDEELS